MIRLDLRRARPATVAATAAALLLAGACSPPVPAQIAPPPAGSAPSASAPAGPAPAGDATCTVARVIDGDTLVCDDGVRIRLLLIDAPELSQRPYGAMARDRLEELAGPGTVLRLEYDVRRLDRYRRTLAYLWLDDGRMVNEELLRSGVAVVAVYPPNVRHVERLRAAVDSAQVAAVGLWSTPAFECAPADHRAGRC